MFCQSGGNTKNYFKKPAASQGLGVCPAVDFRMGYRGSANKQVKVEVARTKIGI